MIQVVHPVFPDPDFLPIPDPGTKQAPDLGSATLLSSILPPTIPFRCGNKGHGVQFDAKTNMDARDVPKKVLV
jgi:hypothetical protein